MFKKMILSFALMMTVVLPATVRAQYHTSGDYTDNSPGVWEQTRSDVAHAVRGWCEDAANYPYNPVGSFTQQNFCDPLKQYELPDRTTPPVYTPPAPQLPPQSSYSAPVYTPPVPQSTYTFPSYSAPSYHVAGYYGGH